MKISETAIHQKQTMQVLYDHESDACFWRIIFLAVSSINISFYKINAKLWKILD